MDIIIQISESASVSSGLKEVGDVENPPLEDPTSTPSGYSVSATEQASSSLSNPPLEERLDSEMDNPALDAEEDGTSLSNPALEDRLGSTMDNPSLEFEGISTLLTNPPLEEQPNISASAEQAVPAKRQTRKKKQGTSRSTKTKSTPGK